jgi:plastocyanin
MNKRKLVAGFIGLCLAITGLAIAVSASAAGGSSVTIKESQTFKAIPNRYVQDGLRWNKDVYKVKSGGTITVVNNKNNEGPHTFTVVKKKDLPRTAAAMFNCKVCNQLAAVHGADPNSDAPPKFQYVEDGKTGQATPPDVNQPGDSGVTGSGQKNEQISFKVTAKKGSQLYFMCIIHPWMQAKVQVQ